jgi:bifunctional non-homologous end joining protein LigD
VIAAFDETTRPLPAFQIMARPLPKSRRQYVQSLNTPTKALLRQFKNAVPAPLPHFIEPLLATLRQRPPVGDNWVHEIKFDGYRFQLNVGDGVVRLLTRRGHDWTGKARPIAAEAAVLNTRSAIIDGEAVVLGADGTTDFNELERELGKGDSERITFYAFDAPFLDGYDLRGETLLNRKRALQLLLDGTDRRFIQYSEHEEGDAVHMKDQLCGMNLEDLVSKLKDGRYASGRSDVWVKAPCRRRDTFAIVGWALKGRKFDGFYLGEERGRKLVYAGKIESGWTEKEKNALLSEVKPLSTRRCPLAARVEKPKAHWVEPRVLVDVEYRAKTSTSGLLRHPSFKGVRRDLMDEMKPRRKRNARTAT